MSTATYGNSEIDTVVLRNHRFLRCREKPFFVAGLAFRTEPVAHIFVQLSLMFFLSGHAIAKTASRSNPPNSRVDAYGSGWECNKGYREDKGGCVKVVLPPNAYLARRSYGRGWSCNWGYREDNDACKSVVVPKNASLDSSGTRWLRHRRYRRIDGTCVAIKVPVHGYWANSAYGSGWKCERGFRRVSEACLTIKLPPNSHLRYSGNDWECNRPNRCELP